MPIESIICKLCGSPDAIFGEERTGEAVELSPLRQIVDRVHNSLDRRRAVN